MFAGHSKSVVPSADDYSSSAMIAGAIAFMVMACGLPAAVSAAEDTRPTVAVMDFGAANTSSGEAAVVSEFVRQAVIRSGKFRVVEKKNQDKILSEQAFQQTGCTASDCAVKLGKLLSARKMVVGEFSAIGGIRFLTASLVDVESGEVERTGRVRGFEPATADLAADRLVSQLTGVQVSVEGAQMGSSRDARTSRNRFVVAPGIKSYSFSYLIDFTNALGSPHTGKYAGASQEGTTRSFGFVVTAEYWRTFSETGPLGFGLIAGMFQPATPYSPSPELYGTPTTGLKVKFTAEDASANLGVEAGVVLFWKLHTWLHILGGVNMTQFVFTPDVGRYDDGSVSGPLTMSTGSQPAMILAGLLGVEFLPFGHLSARFTMALGRAETVRPMLQYTAEFTVNAAPILEAKLLYSF